MASDTLATVQQQESQKGEQYNSYRMMGTEGDEDGLDRLVVLQYLPHACAFSSRQTLLMKATNMADGNGLESLGCQLSIQTQQSIAALAGDQKIYKDAAFAR